MQKKWIAAATLGAALCVGSPGLAANIILTNVVPDAYVTFDYIGPAEIDGFFISGAPEPTVTLHPGDSVEIHNLFETPVFAPRPLFDYFWHNDGNTYGGGRDRLFNIHWVIQDAAGFITGMVDSYSFSGPVFDTAIVGGRFSGAAIASPEPATWALLLLGFGGIGASVRSEIERRRSSCSMGRA
jgi:hypothetical protein